MRSYQNMSQASARHELHNNQQGSSQAMIEELVTSPLNDQADVGLHELDLTFSNLQQSEMATVIQQEARNADQDVIHPQNINLAFDQEF